MKRTFLFLVFVSISLTITAQESKVKWYTFEEAVELNKKNQKKIFIDVYTDWCGWCKKMDATTFTNPQIAKILNEEYYAVKFDAEQKEDITFRGHTYKFIATGQRGYHELAAALLQGKMSYPSVAYLNEQSELLTSVPGYYTPDRLEPILMFFAEDAFKKVSFDEYQKNFKGDINTN
jgi:thioredoxin-related protein